MASLQELSVHQIEEVIAEAVVRQVPLCVTVPKGDTWIHLRSRMISVGEGYFAIEMPVSDYGESHPFVIDEEIGLNFKVRHHKHIFSAPIRAMKQIECADGTTVSGLLVAHPTHMQRLQRRAYIRVDVPEGRIVRAAVWQGGRRAEPAGANPEHPVWAGRITNISAGGFQMVAHADVADVLEPGDAIGVRLVFGVARETLYADAQFRHAEQADNDEALLGFQFIGLGQTDEGCRALDVIGAKVSEYHRAAEHVAHKKRRSH